MDKDISEEAKAALAAAQWRRARERLHRDGAESRPAVQRRIQALAAERSIPPADYAGLMHKRGGTGALIAFCEKHNVSTDWLLMGHLKGLQRMTRDRPSPPPRPVLTPEQFMAALCAATAIVPGVCRGHAARSGQQGAAIMKRDIKALQREIERLQEAKRRALAIADERAKEACELRQQVEQLRAQLRERDQ